MSIPENDFPDRLIEATRAFATPLCVGIDPHLDMIPPLYRRGAMTPDKDATVESVRDFSFELLGRITGKVSTIKPQAAMFERLGPAGMQLLAEICNEAIAAKLLVIIDAKRGDIGSTATAYASALLGHDAPFASDALTVNPFLGLDTLKPFLDAAATTRSGVFALVRTSNADADDIQGFTDGDGVPVFRHLAQKLKPLVEASVAKCGFSSLGIVAGATWPDETALLRRILPQALFLVPGFGAQGGSREGALAGFVDGPEGPEGGIVNSARAVIFPDEAATTQSHTDWRQAIDKALERTISQLRG